MTPTQEDRQHEMIVYLAPGNTNNLEVALGINWSSDFPMHSVSPLIVLNFFVAVCWLKNKAIGNLVFCRGKESPVWSSIY